MTLPEALRLIQHLEDNYSATWDGEAISTELRRLHALTESSNQDLWEICKHYGPVGELIFYKFKNRMKND
jgi:hypothetical protein